MGGGRRWRAHPRPRGGARWRAAATGSLWPRCAALRCTQQAPSSGDRGAAAGTTAVDGSQAEVITANKTGRGFWLARARRAGQAGQAAPASANAFGCHFGRWVLSQLPSFCCDHAAPPQTRPPCSLSPFPAPAAHCSRFTFITCISDQRARPSTASARPGTPCSSTLRTPPACRRGPWRPRAAASSSSTE